MRDEDSLYVNTHVSSKLW